jgi:hypothetical protein
MFLVPATEPAPRVQLLVPAYFYPAGEGLKHWEALAAAAKRMPVRAVVNPASGPGDKADPAYTKLLERLKDQPGLTLLGYVSTRYGKRPLADVKADVDRWRRLYPQIHGLFVDEQASGEGQVGYYASLYEYAKKKHRLRLVVSNPGTVCAEAYLARPAADMACLFEGSKGLADFTPPPWAAKYPARRFAALAYKVENAAQMRQLFRTARAKGIGQLYVTDAAGANPWERLPSYWGDEVAAAAASARGP